ncbi:Serine/threonine-protein kinase PknB [Streptomyces sp. YIM 130001]|nr:Serine/threonine-protein kinase PknB [Streptomyces sp. YIM 130001]
MGAVWRAHDERLKRAVAVKTLHPAVRDPRLDTGAHAAAVARFRREARAAARLHSPHIVTVHDYGVTTDDGTWPYLVMELVEGDTLAEVLAAQDGALSEEDRAGIPDRALPVDRAVRIARQVCRALVVAHAGDVVHRDIKPANVMVARSGEVRVMDFGIAKFVEDVTGNEVTAEGGAIGTVPYMAPERFDNHAVVAGSDVYGLGCVLYQMLTGRPPFESETGGPALIMQHLHTAPTPVRELRPDAPAALEDLLGEMLAKDPAARPTATEAAAALSSLDDSRGARAAVTDAPAVVPVPAAPAAAPVPDPPAAPGPADVAEPELPAATREFGSDDTDSASAPPPGGRRPPSSHLAGGRRRIAVAGVAAAVLVAALVLLFDALPLGDDDGDGAGADGKAARDTYTLAVVGNFSGDGKDRAVTALNSVKMAVDKANEASAAGQDGKPGPAGGGTGPADKGKPGKRLPFRLTTRKFDDSGTKDGAAKAAEEIVADDRIAAVVAPVGDDVDSERMQQASKTYAEHEVVVLSPWTRLSGDLGATTYQAMAAERQLSDATGTFLTDIHESVGLEGIHFLWEKNGSGVPSVFDIGAATTADVPTSTNEVTDTKETVTDILDTGHDTVFYEGGQKAFESLDDRLSKSDFTGLAVTTSDSVRSDYAMKRPWLVVREYCEWDDSYDKPYEDRFGKEASIGGVEAYDATLALVAALGEVDKGSAAPAEVRDTTARRIGEVTPKGLCATDLRFGRDGFLLEPPLFVDSFEEGEDNEDSDPLGDITGDEARERAEQALD